MGKNTETNSAELREEVKTLESNLEKAVLQSQGLTSTITELQAERDNYIQQIEALKLQETAQADEGAALQEQKETYEEKIRLIKLAHEEALASVIPETDNAKLEELQTQLSESIIKEKKT
eukprot:UN00987